MSQIDAALRDFRTHAAPASPDARRDALHRLEAAIGDGARIPRAPWLLRRTAPAAAAAALVAGAGLAVSTVGKESGVLERAQAAVTPNGRVLHVVVRIVEPSGTVRAESWVRPDGTGRSVTLSGAPTSDCLGGRTEMRCYDPARGRIDVYRYHPGAIEAGERFARIPGYRIGEPQSLGLTLRAGYARVLGREVVAGREAYAILLAIPFVAEDGTATPRFDERSPVLHVDPDTYEPVAQHFPDSDSTTYYDTYEYLADDAATAPLLELDAPAGTPVVVHPVGEGPQG